MTEIKDTWQLGVQHGTMKEHKRIIEMLQGYFELTQEPDDHGNITNNPEWDRGFSAAIALIRNNPKEAKK